VKPERWTFVEWEAATRTLLQRARNKCECCGRVLHGRAERHHRQRRGVGGDSLDNLVLVHVGCHAWAHAHPEEARADGLIVSSYGSFADTPLHQWGTRWVMLDAAGGVAKCPPPGRME